MRKHNLQLRQVSRCFVCRTLVADELHSAARASLTNASVKRTEYPALDLRIRGVRDLHDRTCIPGIRRTFVVVCIELF